MHPTSIHKNQRSHPDPKGNFEGVRDHHALGWAFDPQRPGDRLTVEIVCDGRVVASGPADRFRPDLLKAGLGDGRCHFDLPLSPVLFDGRDHTLVARVAGTERQIHGGPHVVNIPRPQGVTGCFEGVRNNQALGWAFDPQRPGDRLTVEIVCDGRVVASGPADRFREDLLEAGFGDGHGHFRLFLSPSLFDGWDHPLTARVACTSTSLHGGTHVFNVSRVAGIGESFRKAALAATVQTGALSRRRGRPTVLACGHIAGQALYGGERSFLDILDGLNSLDYNVVVTVPSAGNENYMRAVQERSHKVFIFPYTWWTGGIPLKDEHIDAFSRIMEKESINAVHVNTIMLREPLLAAERHNIPRVVHVRELVTHDEKICEHIGLPAEKIVEAVLASADHVIANSEATARCFRKPGRTHVVPNTIDLSRFAIPNEVGTGTVRIALISSNLPKKGLWDFIEAAKILREKGSDANFLLVGPENEHTAQIRQKQLEGEVPPNVILAGYRDDPLQAVAEAHIVVNLSNFSESFGRTVLEAMGASRPVVVYDHGALPELVVHGETGFVVPYRDVAAVAASLEKLCADHQLLVSMGKAGRKRAEAFYGKPRYAKYLQEAYEHILKQFPKTKIPTDPPGNAEPQLGRPTTIPGNAEPQLGRMSEGGGHAGDPENIGTGEGLPSWGSAFPGGGESAGGSPLHVDISPRPSAPLGAWWGRLRPSLDTLREQAGSPAADPPVFARIAERLRRNPEAPAVLVPVYNAPDETDACLRSVLRHTSPDCRLLVLDDASSDERVGEVLGKYRGNPRVELYRNAVNLGYTATINRGIELAGRSDVVFLNSDTVVTPRWLEKLRLAAYSTENTGTATAMSNNAGAFSVPESGKNNPLPDAIPLDLYARAIAQTSLRAYPVVPTGNGFCLYVRRDCLDQAGVLDAEAFPRGYGEENDFCMRAGRLGWRHVIDDATFVFHVRSASFGREKEVLMKQGRQRVDERFPEYPERVREFMGGPSMKAMRERVRAVMEALPDDAGSVRGRVLCVLSGRIEDTPRSHGDLVRVLSPTHEIFVLRAHSGGLTLEFFQNESFIELERHVLEAPVPQPPQGSVQYGDTAADWLVRYDLDLVHVHHEARHGREIIQGIMDAAHVLNTPVLCGATPTP